MTEEQGQPVQQPQQGKQQAQQQASIGIIIIGMVIVGTFFAGPGWYLWYGGHKVIGGILLGITAIGVLIHLGMGSFGKVFVAYICGGLCARLVFALLAALFGTP
jgi:hypothetical protein